MENENSTIRVSLDLTPHGVKNVVVSADSPEARDEAIEGSDVVYPNWNCSKVRCKPRLPRSR